MTTTEAARQGEVRLLNSAWLSGLAARKSTANGAALLPNQVSFARLRFNLIGQVRRSWHKLRVNNSSPAAYLFNTVGWNAKAAAGLEASTALGIR